MKKLIVSTFLLMIVAVVDAQLKQPIDAYNIKWTDFSNDSQESLPIGNGDIGLNVWTEKSGDILFYIGKSDAWSEANNTQLVKVGKVRITLSPNPFASAIDFLQSLHLGDGEIVIKGGGTTVRVWVDANAPVIRVESQSAQLTTMKVTLEPWRATAVNKVSADVVVPSIAPTITWYHRIENTNLPSNHNTFGAVIKGSNLTKGEGNTLVSTAQKSNRVSVYPLTAVTESAKDWITQVTNLVAINEKINVEKARAAHQQWWADFWNRSHIYLKGDTTAEKVAMGYNLQRYLDACSSRGAYPIKFNGTIFNMDNPNNTKKEKGSKVEIPDPFDADMRAWGGMYWFQNTRPMYWPMLAAGDYDLMLPLFKMYKGMLPRNSANVKEFYGHDGAYFQETAPFWGGVPHLTKEEKGVYTKHYYLPILELSTMMLDYYHHTNDNAFLKETLLPVVNAGLTFYDQHWGRDANGKLFLDSVNSIEMYWKVVNPTPDIAALHFIIPQLLAIPTGLVDVKSRQLWERMLKELPEIPIGEKNGKQIILPYAGPQTAPAHNTENPGLYAIHPFRVYGLGKPNLDIALNTYKERGIKRAKCWHQDALDEAYLGLANEAQRDVTATLTNKEPRMKFPAFWEKGHDYAPDADNGGNGQHALQLMLLQSEGKKITLLPAWPKEWEADFKLHVDLNTTVEGHVKDGNISNLKVTPKSREADIFVRKD